MADEPHDAVKLLLARMDSHPEEFRLGGKPYSDRWAEHVSDIQAFGNAVDTAALDAKLRDIRLGEIQERVMEELLNGEDRRRKDEEEAAYERKLATLAKQQQILQNNQNAMQQIDTGAYYQSIQTQAVGLTGNHGAATGITGNYGAAPASILKKLLGAR